MCVKRLLICSLCLLLVFLCGCEKMRTAEEMPGKKAKEQSENIGLWIAVYEGAPDEKNEKAYREKISQMTEKISRFGFTDIFFQVRANCDAVYPSALFPACYMYADEGELCFDALEIMCEEAHERGLKIHAWINPYRICSDIKRQPLNLPEGINENEIYKNGDARYLNPCSEKTTSVILGGIREIIENYDVDGIHIDDYFYPTQDKKIDKKEYEAFKKSGGVCDISQYRRDNVSALISSAYSLIKSQNEKLVFSISPGADIDKDKNLLYADVERWCTESGYCDMIIPQIYFGFENENMPFESVFDRWKILTEKSGTMLLTGLAIYKSGKEDKYAGESGKNEWKKNSDIISRQIEYIRKNGGDGFCLFSYSYVFGNRNFTNEEIKNLKNVL